MQKVIFDKARSAEDGFVLYEDLIQMLWPNAMQAAVAVLDEEYESYFRSVIGAHSGVSKNWLEGKTWQHAKESAKLGAQEIPGIYDAMLTYEAAVKGRLKKEASLSRAISRLERRGLIIRLNVGRKNDRGKWIGHPVRAIQLTVNSQELTDRNADQKG